MTTDPQKITFELRVRRARRADLLPRLPLQPSRRDQTDRWSDDARLSDIESGFVCTACGKRGADVRPMFPLARMGTG
jgi:hypothetical protein